MRRVSSLLKESRVISPVRMDTVNCLFTSALIHTFRCSLPITRLKKILSLLPVTSDALAMLRNDEDPPPMKRRFSPVSTFDPDLGFALANLNFCACLVCTILGVLGVF